MKNYFLKLFDYDRHANQLILTAIINANYPAKPVQLMAHLLAAQQIWYNRCAGLPPVAGALWRNDAQPADVSAQIIDANFNTWTNYISSVEDAGFNKIIAYTNLRGEGYTNQLSDICAHVINHGTHHRAQIGQYLKLTGTEILPVTDYIAFVR